MIILTSELLIVQLDFLKEPQRVSVTTTQWHTLLSSPSAWSSWFWHTTKSCLPPSLDLVPGSRPWTPTLDPHQSSYLENSSREEKVSTALHSILSHLDNYNTYARKLFIDFSSAFNIVWLHGVRNNNLTLNTSTTTNCSRLFRKRHITSTSSS